MTRQRTILEENATATFGENPKKGRAAMAAAKDTVTVRIAGEARAVAWSGGVFAGDGELAAAAKALADAEEAVEIAPPGGYATAGSTSRQSAMVAMLGAAKGRGVVVEQDPSLWDGLVDAAGNDDDTIH